MTPPAHASVRTRPSTAAGGRRREPAPRPRPRAVPRPRVAGATAGGSVALPIRRPGLLRRALRGLVALPDHWAVGRLVGGPAWIWLLGLGLGGIVFMQVSLLKMNSGIGRAVESATTIERQNAALESEIGRLSGMERIQAVATKLGMTFAPAESTRFLRARPGYDAQRAARTMRPPKPPAPAATQTAQTAQTATAPAAAQTQTATAPPVAQTQTQTAAPPATQAQTTPPATTATTPPATTQAAPTGVAAAP